MPRTVHRRARAIDRSIHRAIGSAREGLFGGGTGDGSERVLVDRSSDQCSVETADRHDRRRDRRQRDRNMSSRSVVVQGDRRGGADNRDLHRPPVLESDVRTAGSRRALREHQCDAQLVGRRARASRTDPQVGQAHGPGAARRTEFDHRPEHEQRSARVHRRGRVHHVSAERSDVARGG